MSQPSSFVLTPPQGRDRYFPGDLSALIDRKVHLGLAAFSGKYFGAVGLGSSGIAYLGITVEFPGVLLQYSIDAEQFLVANLALNSEPNLTHLAVSGDGTNFVAPWDRCLYLLEQIHDQPSILITNRVKEHQYVPFHRVHRLAVPASPYLLQIRDNRLTLLNPNGEDGAGMKRAALAAANRSFSPYKKSPSGMALKDRNQKVYRGWYMESCVRDVSSVAAVQAALVHFIIEGGTKFEDIVEAVLVEKKDAERSQVGTARVILTNVAPACDFKVYHCI